MKGLIEDIFHVHINNSVCCASIHTLEHRVGSEQYGFWNGPKCVIQSARKRKSDELSDLALLGKF